MKQSLSFINTIQDVPSDTLNTTELLKRAGYIDIQNGQFISLLPLGKRVIQKIENIIREELSSIAANEISLPILNTSQNSSKTKDLDDSQLDDETLYFVPSHVDVMTSIVKGKINSPKQLPTAFYQLQTRLLEEKNTNGLFKSNEYTVLDVYSFHQTMESLDDWYNRVAEIYGKIIGRLGLSYKKLEGNLESSADYHSDEFVILSDSGDTTIAYSSQSDYAVNIDMAKALLPTTPNHCEMKELSKLNITDNPLADELQQLPANQIIKTKILQVKDELVVILYRGDYSLNEVKLKNILNVQKLTYADERMITEIIGCSANFVGPIKLPVNVNVIADHSIKSICNGIAFGNEDGCYYCNVNPERDFAVNAYEDLRYILEGEPSPDGNGTLQFMRGYEVAHLYKLGSTYAKLRNATFVDEEESTKPLLMGVYELGISRLFAVASEFSQDDQGFVWSNAIAPFNVHLITESIENDEQRIISEQLYNILSTYQFEVLFDDRDSSLDMKVKDANLIGVPVQVIVGKSAVEGIVKVQYRRTGESFECAKEELIDRLNEFFRAY